MKIRERYKFNKKSKVNNILICPSCGTVFTKTNYQQAFCKSKSGTTCKDYYWNNVTPTKRNNITRISPASAAYMAKNKVYWEYVDFDDDQSWDAHKDSF